MFGLAIESQPLRLSNHEVLDLVIESLHARVDELERINTALKASYEERGEVIKLLSCAKD